MDVARMARLLALLALAVWLAKAVAIWAAGGLDQSALEAPLFFAGLLTYAAGAVIPETAGWVTEEAGLWASAAVLVVVTQWRLAAPPRREQATAA
jgi:hypothetical protein